MWVNAVSFSKKLWFSVCVCVFYAPVGSILRTLFQLSQGAVLVMSYIHDGPRTAMMETKRQTGNRQSVVRPVNVFHQTSGCAGGLSPPHPTTWRLTVNVGRWCLQLLLLCAFRGTQVIISALMFRIYSHTHTRTQTRHTDNTFWQQVGRSCSITTITLINSGGRFPIHHIKLLPLHPVSHTLSEQRLPKPPKFHTNPLRK